MGLIEFLKKIKLVFGNETRITPQETIYQEQTKTSPEPEDIHSIWDYLKFQENTQAFHLVNIVGFDEWVDMEEIRRRILELFNIEYKNERSLYPYLKTLTDIGFFETNNVGGRRKWRKKDLIFRTKNKITESEENKKITKKLTQKTE